MGLRAWGLGCSVQGLPSRGVSKVLFPKTFKALKNNLQTDGHCLVNQTLKSGVQCQGFRVYANSLIDHKNGKFPSATHYIYNDKESIEKKEMEINERKKATDLVDKISTEKKIELILILSDEDFSNKSISHINVRMAELIDRDAKNIITY